MQDVIQIICSFAAAGLLPAVLAAPAPQLDYAENTGPVAGVSPPIPTATAFSGSLYGDESLLGEVAKPSPISGGDSAIVSDFPLVNGQEADSKLGLYLDFNSVENPQPLRGTGGQTQPGPRTFEYEKLNPDLYAPPGTDSGSIDQAQWPMGLSHNRFGTGKQSGWARQQNTDQLPAAAEMAGVNMRLAPHAYRELHWHIASEWGLILKGSVRLSAMNEDGETFIDDVGAGDVWVFPAGVPHSIQALDEGVEFLLVFDQGDFSEDNTFLASELMLRNPKEVLSKNLQAPISAFDNLPTDQLYIFGGTAAPADISEQNMTALVVVEPGAMRELHWHLTSDEWNFFIQGSARITLFNAPDASRTFDYTAGDVGYIPVSQSHYIENTGTEDVIFLEVLQQPKFTDISVAQWLALTPKQVVKDTLHLPDSVLDNLPKTKTYLKVGNQNLTALAGNPNGTAAFDTSGNTASPAPGRKIKRKFFG
ncbi:Oxalate decarboxylase [Hyphodiscus hymeniophilus]|uniref:Oxalate decarboxylase n=1 Tax=Hyphodiscus hymeniophilus TaxID=353542 RepID=A0A9P6VDZ4_9HELO|nr:Oxalate decarboxylase [Hyphodiscus hymeniophilus]